MSFKDELKSYINLTAESIQETRSTSFDPKFYDDIAKNIYDYIHSQMWGCVQRKKITSKKVGFLRLNKAYFYEYTQKCEVSASPNNDCTFYEESGSYQISIGYWEDIREVIKRLYYLLKKDKYDEIAYGDYTHDFYTIKYVDDIDKIIEYIIQNLKNRASVQKSKCVGFGFMFRVLFYCDEDGKI